MFDYLKFLFVVIFSLCFVTGARSEYVSIHQAYKNYYYCTDSQEAGCVKDLNYCDENMPYKCKLTVKGFRSQYNYCDARILCRKDVDWESCYTPGITKSIYLRYEYPEEREFRIFVPPYTRFSVVLFMWRDAEIGLVARWGRPPSCEYCNVDRSQVPWGKETSLTFSMLENQDVYLYNAGGHIEIDPIGSSSGNTEGGWLFVKLLFYGSDGINVLTVSEDMNVDNVLTWWYGEDNFCNETASRVDFSSCGDPLSWQFNETITVNYIESDACYRFDYGSGIAPPSSGGSSSGSSGEDNTGENTGSTSCDPFRAMLGLCSSSDSNQDSENESSCNVFLAMLGRCNLQEKTGKHFPDNPEVSMCDSACTQGGSEFDLKINDGRVTLKTNIPKYDKSVDVYMAITIPDTNWIVGWDEDGFYACELKEGEAPSCYRNCSESNGTITCESSNTIYPFKTNLSDEYIATILDNAQIDCQSLPAGEYYLYWLLVPSGESLGDIDWENDPYILRWLPFNPCQ